MFATMASTEGLVPITRSFLASYYDKYPFAPLCDDVTRLSSQLRSFSDNLLADFTPVQGERDLIEEANRDAPHKIDENMWKNREHMEEIVFLIGKSNRPSQLCKASCPEDKELAGVFDLVKDKIQSTLDKLQSFQAKNSDRVFNTVMTYLPQDFRGTLIKQQRERSERNKQAEVDALINSGGSIRDKYALLWRQQMDRRQQLAQLGSASGVYKTLVKYLVGVPQVLLDFIKQINDDDGPMEEQRQRYGPPVYSLTALLLSIRLFISLSWRRCGRRKINKSEVEILEEAVNVYTSEFERFFTFMSEVFANSPFLVSATDAGLLEGGKNDEYREVIVPAGSIHEVSLEVESLNSYIAWDFSLVQSALSLDIGFSVECINPKGERTSMLPYRRYDSDQGNFCTLMAGNYKLIWDNSYSTFFKKTVRYKVDCIPPVVEPIESTAELEQ